MRINWNNVLTGGAFVVHVGVASLVVGAATVWAVVGLLGLPPPVAAVLYTAALAAALGATATFARIAHEAQPFFEQIPEEPSRSSDPTDCDAPARGGRRWRRYFGLPLLAFCLRLLGKSGAQRAP